MHAGQQLVVALVIRSHPHLVSGGNDSDEGRGIVRLPYEEEGGVMDDGVDASFRSDAAVYMGANQGPSPGDEHDHRKVRERLFQLPARFKLDLLRLRTRFERVGRRISATGGTFNKTAASGFHT